MNAGAKFDYLNYYTFDIKKNRVSFKLRTALVFTLHSVESMCCDVMWCALQAMALHNHISVKYSFSFKSLNIIMMIIILDCIKLNVLKNKFNIIHWKPIKKSTDEI